MTSVFDTATKAIAIGSDHAGFEYKEAIKIWLVKEGFTVKNICENLKAEFSLNISAASVAVWQHKRLEKPLEIEDVWGSDPWDDAEGKDSSDEEDGRPSGPGKADEKAAQEGDFDD